MQIKYLRVPDMLLDVVKEEQTRAREAGKSARGGPHTGGIGGRGAEHVLPLPILLAHCTSSLAGRGGGAPRGQSSSFRFSSIFSQLLRHPRSFLSGGRARGGPPRGGRARGRGM